MIDLLETVWIPYDEGDPDFVRVAGIEWEHDYKDTSTRYTIIHHISEDRYYQANEVRSGSYYSDYYYEEPEIFEVTPEKRMVEQILWKIVDKKVD